RNAEDETRFINQLDQALAPLTDPKDIVTATVRALGEYLGVERCVYGEVEADQDHIVVTADYARDTLPSMRGRYQISDFRERERKVLLENEPYVVNDIETETPPGIDISSYRRWEARSLVCVPLNKDGHWVAGIAVSQIRARRWSSQEIKLIGTVTY